MAWIEVNPRYQQHLEALGLLRAELILDLPSIVVNGHPDRNVARVCLGTGEKAMVGYLKSEHRVRMRSRLHGFFSGCRFGSKSRREQRLLQALALDGIGCPEWIAVGEDDKGRAFLLVREIVNTVEMPVYLQGCSDDDRRALCKRLGQDLARMHDAGFDHPDLYAKHVLIRPADKAIFFLDWQRSRRHTHVPWRRRARDLAALNASLAEELASCRHRLACLGAYLRTTAPSTVPRCLVPSIERRCRHLLRRRRVREMRQPGAPESKQRLIRLDGDGLCVSSDFRKTYPDVLPAWLETNAGAHRNGIVHEEQTLADGTAACLTRRSEFRPIRGLVARLVRWRQTSPELREVGVLFRLERFGITIARVLAFGQRSLRWGGTTSFLLIERLPRAQGLGSWLESSQGGVMSPLRLKERRRILRQAGSFWRQVHAAGCHLALSRQNPGVLVQEDNGGRCQLVLARASDIHTRSWCGKLQSFLELRRWLQSVNVGCLSRTDALRFWLAYEGEDRLNVEAKPGSARWLRRHEIWRLGGICIRSRPRQGRWSHPVRWIAALGVIRG